MQIQSPFQINCDIQNYRTFADYFFATTAEYGTRLAMVGSECGNQNWRFSELQKWTEKCMKRLAEIGVTPSSCVALVSSISPYSIFVQLAASSIGCNITVLNGNLGVDELWHLVDASESTHCVVETQFQQRIDDVRRKALMRGSARIRVIKRLDEVVGDTPLTLQKRESRTQMSTSQKDAIEGDSSALETGSTISCSTIIIRDKPPISQIDSIDENSYSSKSDSNKLNSFLILFSSGTTRQPKPVQITHQTVIANLESLRSQIYGPPQASDRFLLSLCMSTIYGLYSAFHALINGAELYMLPKHSNKSFLKALIDYKITYTHITPSTLQFLANDLSLETVNLKPHLRSIISGGATLDPQITRQCKERLGLRDIRQIYGMTELGGPCIYMHAGCDTAESAGRPLPGVLAKIMQFDSKQLCGPRQPGHLLITGTNIYANIYRNSKATSDLLTSDGYVKTGDAAFFDENGLIYVMDRIKDVIKYRGSLVCPSEVENTLRSHPGIEDCAVVGRQDHVSNEVPAAFVVKKHTHSMLTTSEIRQFVSGKIPQFKELRGGVFFLTEIPRSICGKILRHNLRQHWDRERMGSKAEINGTPPLKDNTTNNRKASKTAEDLGKVKRSVSITPATNNKIVRPIARQIRQKKNNRSTD